MKLVYLIGVPGSGKTTVVKEFMNKFAGWQNERVTDLLDTVSAGHLCVLGKYDDGETFAGTDRLSMAVAPKAIEWIKTKPPKFILGEGDRLNNKGFFEAAGDDLTIVHLTVSDAERERRYKERGSEQKESFIKTTKTKCENILNEFGDKQTLFGEEKGCVTEFTHETPEDTRNVVEFLLMQFLHSSAPWKPQGADAPDAATGGPP